MMDKKVAVITGGTGGIGWHLSKGYQEAGFQVVAIDIKAHKPVSEGVVFIEADLRSDSEIKRVFDRILEAFGSIHVLINNAAIAHFHKPFLDVTADEWDQVIDVNLRGAFLCSQAFVRANEGQDYGRIVNIASTRWHQNESHHDAYGASKGGLVSLTQSMCVSLSSTPITVNTVSPGWIQVENYESVSEADHLQHPSRRVGRSEDIVRACLFFTEESNDFVNGAHLIVDGGMTKRMIYL